ncbi:MAG: hypothetical protein AMK69_13695 [Nitrospira bacterium SG8_3]|nr:MAG: hypothetical protein AMK69_13695 [Nitrospira bacterium SG8_3]
MNEKLPNNRLEKDIHVLLSYLNYLLFILIASWGVGGAPALGASPMSTQEQEEARDLIYQSSQATEQAWEEFHAAAIGGTLASPAVQSNIERQLHESRALLMEARKAARAHQFDLVKSLTEKIIEITQNIVQASREKKQ